MILQTILLTLLLITTTIPKKITIAHQAPSPQIGNQLQKTWVQKIVKNLSDNELKNTKDRAKFWGDTFHLQKETSYAIPTIDNIKNIRHSYIKKIQHSITKEYYKLKKLTLKAKSKQKKKQQHAKGPEVKPSTKTNKPKSTTVPATNKKLVESENTFNYIEQKVSNLKNKIMKHLSGQVPNNKNPKKLNQLRFQAQKVPRNQKILAQTGSIVEKHNRIKILASREEPVPADPKSIENLTPEVGKLDDSNIINGDLYSNVADPSNVPTKTAYQDNPVVNMNLYKHIAKAKGVVANRYPSDYNGHDFVINNEPLPKVYKSLSESRINSKENKIVQIEAYLELQPILHGEQQDLSQSESGRFQPGVDSLPEAMANTEVEGDMAIQQGSAAHGVQAPLHCIVFCFKNRSG